MRFDEQWIDDEQLSQTAELARSTNLLAGEVIEIGTWQGRSAIPIAQVVAPALLHVVDHWLGDGRGDPSPERVARDNYGIFLANVAEAGLENVRVWKMGWQEFVRDWNQPIRFVHIDAAHSADEVASNIMALKPFAVNGAIFSGDDYNSPPVSEGVHRQFTSIHSGCKDKLWWTVL